MMNRRQFVKSGAAAFTVSFAAPAFLSDLARAQGAANRNLVVLALAGGNDGLSTLVPYTDPFYYSRRPTLAIPAGTVLQVGSDSGGAALGLHPRLTALRNVFNSGKLALIQRVGYQNSSRSHFTGTDIWSVGEPPASQGSGWLGRYLSTLGPLDPLAAWTTTGDTPHSMLAAPVAHVCRRRDPSGPARSRALQRRHRALGSSGRARRTGHAAAVVVDGQVDAPRGGRRPRR